MTCGWSCAIFLIEIIYWIVLDDALTCASKLFAGQTLVNCCTIVKFSFFPYHCLRLFLLCPSSCALCNPLYQIFRAQMMRNSKSRSVLSLPVRFKPIKNDVNRQSVEQIMWLSVIKTSISSTLDWDGFDSCRNLQSSVENSTTEKLCKMSKVTFLLS